jgi:hypothetical protein
MLTLVYPRTESLNVVREKTAVLVVNHAKATYKQLASGYSSHSPLNCG